MKRILISVLGVREEEVERVLVLLSAASFLGFSLILFYTSSSAIFLAKYSTDLLPHVYILNAAFVILLSFGYAACEKRFQFLTLLYGVAALLTASIVFFWISLFFTQSPILKFLVMAWYRVLFIFGTMGLWEIAARLLNIQEAKRLFTVIAAGMLFAVIIGGLVTTPLANLIGTTHLLLISGIGMGLYVWQLIRTLPRFKARLEIQTTQDVANINPLAVLQNRYILLIFAFKIIAVSVSNILEFVFYQQASVQYPTESSLAGFIGMFVSVMTLSTILMSGLVAGRFIARYGLRATLPVSPAVMTAGSFFLVVIGVMVGITGSVFFGFLALLRLIDGVFFSAVTTPMMAMLYQPLKSSERAWVRVQSEGKMGSVALAFSGFTLLSFQLFPDTNLLVYIALLGILAGIWLMVAFQTYRGYAYTLKKSVRNVFLRHSVLSSSAARSVHTESLINLGEADTTNLQLLHDMLEQQDADIQMSVLEHIQQERLIELAPSIEALVRNSSQPDPVRELGLRVWGTLAPDEVQPFLQTALQDLGLRRRALVMLLQLGVGESMLQRFAVSADVKERKLAAEALSEWPQQPALILSLLNDVDTEVVHQAIRAAANVNDPNEPLMTALFLLLPRPEFRGSVIEALSTPGALPSIQHILMNIPSGDVQTALFEICGRINDPGSENLLRTFLSVPEPLVRLWVLRALNRISLSSDYALDEHLKREIEIATQILHIMVDIQLPDLLKRALEDELSLVQERVFRLLALNYPRDVILGAYEHWLIGVRKNDQEMIGHALEGLFIILSYEHRSLLLTLIEADSAEKRLKRLGISYELQSSATHFTTLLQQPRSGWARDWTRACVWHIYLLPPQDVITEGFPLLQDVMTQKDQHMFSIIDKVAILRTVSIFSQTSDAVLAEIARLLQEQTFHSGEIIIREQQPGSSLYIMIEGQAQIHRQGHTRDHIEAPEIFGELSVLDAAPRSASVTAQTEVKVFVLGREALYQLMSTRQEIMEGVIQVLCQRVRQAVSD